jgi:hypothetical protein
MTNEEYGRKWARKNNVPPPNRYAPAKWLWYNADHNGYPQFHTSLCTLLDLDFYRDEAAAYADLGRAVQEIHREIPALGDTE